MQKGIITTHEILVFTSEDGSYDNTWGHSDFFRDPTIVEINWFANIFIDQPEYTSDYFDQVALIERGPAGATEGVVIVNTGFDTREIDFVVQMVDGEYIDQISGEIFTVAGGRITGSELEGQGVAVIYGLVISDSESSGLIVVGIIAFCVTALGIGLVVFKKKNE